MKANYEQQKGEPIPFSTNLMIERTVDLILDEVSIRDTLLRLDIPSREAEGLERLKNTN